MSLLKKIFRPSSSGIASVILLIAAGLSYMFGLFRDILLGNYFGANALTDAYNTAFLVPDFIYTLTVAGALSGIFLPIFRKTYSKNHQSGWDLASSFLVVSQTFVCLLSVIAYFAMPWLIGIIPNVDPSQSELIIQLSRVMLLSPIIFTLSNSLGIFLNSFKHYVAYALSATFYNAGIIFGIWLWHDQFGIMSAAYGVALGLLLHAAIRVIDFAYIKYHEPSSAQIRLKSTHPQLKEVYKLAFPKTLGLLAWQLCLWTYNIIGYSLAGGSIAAFNYGRNIQSFAVSLFGISIATAVFPFLVDHVTNQEQEAFKDRLTNTALQIAVYTIPAAIGLAILAPEAISVLLERGAFDQTDVLLTASVLVFFAIAIPFESLNHLFARAFYSFNNVWTPVIASLIFMAINIGGSYLLAPTLGVSAFGLMFAIATFVQISILIYMFSRRYHQLPHKFYTRLTGIIGCAAIMGVGVYLSKAIDFSFINNLNLLTGWTTGQLAKLQVFVGFFSSVSIGVLLYGLLLLATGLFSITGLQQGLQKLRKG